MNLCSIARVEAMGTLISSVSVEQADAWREEPTRAIGVDVPSYSKLEGTWTGTKARVAVTQSRRLLRKL